MVGFLKSIFGGKPTPISITEFRDQFIAGARKVDPAAELEVIDDKSLSVRRGDQQGTIFVENAYARYLREPARLDFHMGQLLTLFANAAQESSLGVNQLVVVARHVDYGKGTGADILMRPLAGDVGLLLAFDTPTALGAVMKSTLAELELTEDEAFARACENLKERIGELVVQRFEHANVFHIRADSGLATGALALPDLWRNGVAACVVFAITREAFLWCDMTDAKAVTALRQFAKVVKVPDPLSNTFLALENGAWRDIGMQEV